MYTEPATAASANGAGAQPGLIFGCGREGAWDAGGVGNPVVFPLNSSRGPSRSCCVNIALLCCVGQVRCFLGDDEQRWCMWYNGHSAAAVNGPVPAPCIGILNAIPNLPLACCSWQAACLCLSLSVEMNTGLPAFKTVHGQSQMCCGSPAVTWHVYRAGNITGWSALAEGGGGHQRPAGAVAGAGRGQVPGT